MKPVKAGASDGGVVELALLIGHVVDGTLKGHALPFFGKMPAHQNLLVLYP